jgi:N-acetylglucosaminyldiphosphoundecaprenol N-acetyl-beta-D-mannosaminyltransferase
MIAVASKPIRRQVEMFGIAFDRVRMEQAVAQLLVWLREPDGPCQYVVTPNVDHVVLFQRSAALRQAYAGAGLVLADGAPVVAASQLLGRPLPERVAGSDLVPRLLNEAVWQRIGLRVYLLGGMPGVANRAAERIEKCWPGVRVVGTASPPPGFEADAELNAQLVARINDSQPDVLLIGLGAPKQELWVHRHHAQLNVPVALCVGSTIDFLAGQRRRAPRWMRRVGLEWLFRMLLEPRRLARRYARDAWLFPRLVWREWRDRDDETFGSSQADVR